MTRVDFGGRQADSETGIAHRNERVDSETTDPFAVRIAAVLAHRVPGFDEVGEPWRRKRAVVLAGLPRERYRSAIEPAAAPVS